MGFEKFHKSYSTGRTGIHATLSKSGHLRFSRSAAAQFLDGAQHVELFYNKQTRQIGVQPVKGPTPDSYSLNKDSVVCAQKFRSYYGLAGSVVYTPSRGEDGMIVLTPQPKAPSQPTIKTAQDFQATQPPMIQRAKAEQPQVSTESMKQQAKAYIEDCIDKRKPLDRIKVHLLTHLDGPELNRFISTTQENYLRERPARESRERILREGLSQLSGKEAQDVPKAQVDTLLGKPSLRRARKKAPVTTTPSRSADDRQRQR